MRKEILAYDDVANDQRKVIYAQRNELMAAEDIADIITAIQSDVINDVITDYIQPNTMEEQWDIKGLEEHIKLEFDAEIPLREMLEQDHSLHEETIRQRIVEMLREKHKDKEEKLSSEVLRHFEKSVMLQVVDNSWKEHLAAMDHLRQGIHFRGYAQKDPKQEYKREAFEMFTRLLEHIKHETIGILSKVRISQEEDVQAMDQQLQAPREMHYEHAEASAMEEEEPEQQPAGQEEESQQPFVRSGKKVGRNEPCPCGSGKKFKQCHGKLT